MMGLSLAWVCYDGCVVNMGALSAGITLLQDGCVISMGVLLAWDCCMMDLCLSAWVCYHHGCCFMYVT